MTGKEGLNRRMLKSIGDERPTRLVRLVVMVKRKMASTANFYFLDAPPTLSIILLYFPIIHYIDDNGETGKTLRLVR